ncbi:hypothetical protein CSUI_003453 [Cystoisospora suis]|uniref:Uncharacterized protein n=1 Tax=Cystoisospora suis TaxID=483139 RepID=A0A2C6L4W2_9APIC|nr:hypothetical protein CSUI_003453 [Cystoisospora suis]
MRIFWQRPAEWSRVEKQPKNVQRGSCVDSCPRPPEECWDGPVSIVQKVSKQLGEIDW